MKEMQIYYFSTALSDDIYNSIVKDCNSFKPTFSGVGFDRNVAVGLSNYADVQGVSLYPIPSWPKYKRLLKESEQFQIGNFKCFIPSMIDLPVLKEFSYYLRTKRFIEKHMNESKNTIIVISGLYRSLLRPAQYLKKKYGLKVCAIVPDLPELMITYRKDYSKLRRFLNKLDVKKSQRYRACVDGFIFLSKYMDEQVNQKEKPVVIVDGLTDIASFPNRDDTETKNFVLYAGKVSSTFGVDKLVEAFLQSNLCDSVQLYICGDGDYAGELKKIVAENSSIHYFGSVPHHKVLQMEVQASLLVDPRPSNMEIVKMSFPSKIIEYMASGTPVLTTNLPCFSEEYREYQYRIDDESVDGIKIALENVFSLSDLERNTKGKNAKQFIMENKTMEKQCETIMTFLKQIEGK